MKTCPSCGAELEHLGSQGIVDHDDEWASEAVKYRCKRGLHIVFLVDAREIEEEVHTPWVEALECIQADLDSCNWGEDGVLLEKVPDYSLPQSACDSLEDMRNELANRAVVAFGVAKARDSKFKDTDAAYDYIEAMKDVDYWLDRYTPLLSNIREAVNNKSDWGKETT